MNCKSLLNSVSRIRNGYLLSSAMILLLLLISTGLYSQTNFSGSWAFNESKSNLGDGGGPRMAATALTVVQQGNTLSIDRTQPSMDGNEMKSSEKYTLDGKESTNPGMMGSTTKSVVTWTKDQKALSFVKNTSMERDGEKMEFKATEAWALSADGSTLTIESVFNSPMGEMKTTLVYSKK
jgi:hypothetical protein